MKKLLVITGILIAVSACNSNDKTKEDIETPNKAGVQNVNGNIPDTTNAIDLNHTTDTTIKPSDSGK
jgi:hypothetical protein